MASGNRSKALAAAGVIGGVLTAVVVGVALPSRAGQSGTAATEWSQYGGPTNQRYSTLTQINRDNVAQLKIAWEYDAGEGPGGTQTQPLVAGGVLYTVTPKHNFVALDAATGKQLWKFESGVAGRGANRGLAMWTDGTQRRLFAGVQNWVYALDGATGKPIAEFGANGRIDLREGLGRDPGKQSIILTTPGVVYKDLYIVGGRTSEGLPATPGDIRAYDVRTGKTAWTFRTIPRPGDKGYETWPKLTWKVAGAANNWAGMTVDHKRGLVFVPTGSAAMDFYGANRHGDNLYANTLLALDANTGKRVWHFQAVKHDIWDRDFPSPPILVRAKKGSRWVDAVAQTAKSGHVWLFERSNGKPIYPIEYKTYPASDVPGEQASKTQPLPTKPAPFARQHVDENMLTNRTPEANKFAREKFRTFHYGGPFTPFRANQETVLFPGFDGAGEWGGPGYDPETNILYINSNEMVWTSSLTKNEHQKTARQLYLQHCANCHSDTLKGAPPQYPSLIGLDPKKWNLAAVEKITRDGAGRMPGFPNLSPAEVRAVSEYTLSGESKAIEPDEPAVTTLDYRFTGYHKFLDQDGYPAVSTPWGTLNALDLKTGEYLWKIPFGSYPELAEKGMKDTGSENYGGPVVTAGGLIFIGATNYDRKFRAFDKTSGKLLWETTLPFSANATPAVYSANGKQYVVICSEGAKSRPQDPKGSRFIAFALP